MIPAHASAGQFTEGKVTYQRDDTPLDSTLMSVAGEFSLVLPVLALDGQAPVGKEYSLGQSYPNPGNPSVTIQIRTLVPVTVTIYNKPERRSVSVPGMALGTSEG